MKMTETDYRERKARLDAGTGDDEDRRLVKLYEREGLPDSWEAGFTATAEAEVTKQPRRGRTPRGKQ